MHSGIFVDCISPERKKSIFRFGENKSMSETLDEISRISGYSFFYYDGLFSSARKVTLKTTNLTIRQTLDKLFEGSENTYASTDSRYSSAGPRQKSSRPPNPRP